MSDTTMQIRDLTVRYGNKIAVDGVTMNVTRGAVYALVGRNGAGKSSLVRCLLGQQKPQRGSVTLFGEDVWSRRTALMQRIGVVSEEADAPPEMSVAAIARFCSRLYDKWDQDSVEARLRTFDVPLTSRFGSLSKGQKKQVSLAMALASSPELLVLDDPTLGLDVVARKSLFEEIIGDLADRGTTVFITTHDLIGVETFADRVGMMENGRLVLDENVDALKSRFRRIRFATQPAAIDTSMLRPAAMRAWGGGAEAIVSNYDDISFERMRSVSSLGSAEVEAMSLEEIFIAVAGGNRGGNA
ncbi:MAG: type transport system ATP-binding protein [Thermoanaerobaculia bacterium]|jgi:ABC-2 type transport system ATP-binding protein|nr:type transport system ATP-binding protein [Thermoanaerobaculia bacterium]